MNLYFCCFHQSSLLLLLPLLLMPLSWIIIPSCTAGLLSIQHLRLQLDRIHIKTVCHVFHFVFPCLSLSLST
jgi:hypothetical protein